MATVMSTSSGGGQERQKRRLSICEKRKNLCFIMMFERWTERWMDVDDRVGRGGERREQERKEKVR